MQNLHFTLRFDDEEHSLTAENGLKISEVSALLHSLAAALSIETKSKQNLVLSEIRGNCYALQLTTSSLDVHANLKLIHENLSVNNFDTFTPAQKKYATTLKAIIGDKRSLQAYTPDKDFNVSVDSIDISKIKNHYFEIDTIQGLITSIGGTTLEGKTYIDISGQNYKIEISESQENQLINYYKKTKISFKIKKKINLTTDKIISAELLSFEELGKDTFLRKIQNHKKTSEINLFPDIDDAPNNIRKLRD